MQNILLHRMDSKKSEIKARVTAWRCRKSAWRDMKMQHPNVSTNVKGNASEEEYIDISYVYIYIYVYIDIVTLFVNASLTPSCFGPAPSTFPMMYPAMWPSASATSAQTSATRPALASTDWHLVLTCFALTCDELQHSILATESGSWSRNSYWRSRWRHPSLLPQIPQDARLDWQKHAAGTSKMQISLLNFSVLATKRLEPAQTCTNLTS